MRLLSRKELAAKLGVHPNTVWRSFHRGEIPGECIGRVLVFDWNQVRKWMQENALAVQKRRAQAGAVRRKPNARAKKPPCR